MIIDVPEGFDTVQFIHEMFFYAEFIIPMIILSGVITFLVKKIKGVKKAI
jgi:hypothetical protein